MEMIWFKILLFLCVIYCTEGRKKNICPEEFVKVSGSCYYFSKSPETWHEAHFECRDRNAQLAVVQKKWQDKNLRFYLNHSPQARLQRWIGGMYNWKAMIWIWGPTGKPLRYRGFPKKRDPADNRWKCITVDPTIKYRWNAKSCVERLHYICEIPIKKLKKQEE